MSSSLHCLFAACFVLSFAYPLMAVSEWGQDYADSGGGIYSDERWQSQKYEAPSVTKRVESAEQIYQSEPSDQETATFVSEGMGSTFFSEAGDEYADLFADAEDIEVSPDQQNNQGPVINATSGSSSNSKKIDFYGKFNTNIGMLSRIYPESKFTPFASFENYLGFTARPYDDISIRGQLYANFPDFNIVIDTLYFDYMVSDYLFVKAGATGESWGNSFIFDTNILDDEANEKTNIYAEEHKSSKRFDAIFTIPVGRLQLQGIGMYQHNEGADLSTSNLSYAGSVEYPFGPFAVKVFARRWAKNDPKSMDKAVGAEVTADILGNHVTLWGKIHPSMMKNIMDVEFAKFVAGISRIVRTDLYGDFGVVLEYQFTYDLSKAKSERKNHSIGFTFGWHDAFDTDFSPAVRWYYDLSNRSGYVIPSLTFGGLPHGDITLIIPVVYGGASYTYRSLVFSSEKGTPTVLLGIVFTLSVSY